MREGEENLRFFVSQKRCEIGPTCGLLLITNRKSHSGSRLPLNYNKIEVLWIFWRFRAAKHISRANYTETN